MTRRWHSSPIRSAEGRPSLEGVALDASLRATLERLMPIYRKHWWPDHDRAHATHWGPRLDGKVSVADALGALVASFK